MMSSRLHRGIHFEFNFYRTQNALVIPQDCYVFTDIMVNMGYARKDVEDSLTQNKYDDITATYLLLGRRTAMVRS